MTRALLFCVALLFPATHTQAQDLTPALQSVLQRLSASAPTEYADQIVGAIQATPLLKAQLGALAEAGILKEIKAQEQAALPAKAGMFGGFAGDNSILFTLQYLVALRKERYFDVRHDDDVPPNHMVFALGHLAQHLAAADELRTAQRNLRPAALGDMVNLQLQTEARAWIAGWNAMINNAIIRNGPKPLAVPQIGQLIMNFRYRAFVLKAMKPPADDAVTVEALTFSPSGALENSPRNVAAFVAALKHSQMADIE